MKRFNLATVRMFSFEGEFGNAIVTSIPATELARLYDKYENILFDCNVRLVLGSRKGSVNAGIFDTLLDDQQRAKFWAFNNGITMLCDTNSRLMNRLM